MKKIKITDKITYVDPAHMKNFTACAGLIIDAGKKVLIDTNMADETAALIANEKPDLAFITHYHIDHSAWAHKLLEYSDAELLVPEGEEEYLRNLEFLLSKSAEPCGYRDEWRDFIINITHYKEISNFRSYNESTVIELDGITIEPVDSCGHSPFHKSFYIPEEKIIFCGDAGIDRYGPWYGWPDCDLKKMTSTLLKMMNMEIKTILTGHGTIVSQNINEEISRCLNFIPQREKKIIDMLDQGFTKKEIVADGIFFKHKHMFQEPMRTYLYMWDNMMYDHHFNVINEGGINKFFTEL